MTGMGERTKNKPGRHARPLTRSQRVRNLLGAPAARNAPEPTRQLLSGPVGVLRILALVVAGLGLVYLPFDVADQHRARELEQHGIRAFVTDVRVHVGYVPARGGGWYEVDHVQVHLPDVGGGDWVDVTGLPNLEMNKDVKGQLWEEGWQKPTGATSYRPPLEVVYREGRNVDAMIPGDVARWSDSDDAAISIGLATAGLGATAVAFAKPLASFVRRRRISL